MAFVSAGIQDVIRKTISFSNFQDRGDGSRLIIGSRFKKKLHDLIVSNKTCALLPLHSSPDLFRRSNPSDERLLIHIKCLLLPHLSMLGDSSSSLCLHKNSSVITFAGKVPIFGEEEAQI